MKILLINKFYYRKGGSETALFAEKELLERHGHQVAVFSMTHPDNEPSLYARHFVDHIDFNRSEGFLRDLRKAGHLIYSPEARQKLTRLIDAFQPDIAHVHNMHYQLTPSIFTALRARSIPVVWTLHDYKLVCPNAELYTQGSVCERCKVRRYYNAFLFRCVKNSWLKSALAMCEAYLHGVVLRSYRSVHRFIVPSMFLEEKLAAWGIDSKRVVHLYNMAPATTASAHERKPFVLYAGRLTPVKGIETLLEAFADLKNIQLVIAGDGPLTDYVRQFVHSHNATHISYIGKQSPTEVRRLMSEALCVVVPSVWYENNPLTVLESFAQATPVIASHIGGLSELIGKNERGITVPPQDPVALRTAIVSLAARQEYARSIGEHARTYVTDHMNTEQHYRQLMEIYSGAIVQAK